MVHISMYLYFPFLLGKKPMTMPGRLFPDHRDLMGKLKHYRSYDQPDLENQMFKDNTFHKLSSDETRLDLSLSMIQSDMTIAAAAAGFLSNATIAATDYALEM